MKFYKAKTFDLNMLREIAYESEKIWDVGENFMDVFDDKYNITEEFIEKEHVFYGVDKNEVIGFWGIKAQEGFSELVYFYIDHRWINQGYGRKIWEHLVSWSKDQGIQEFTFITSDRAAKFYKKMGATLMEGKKSPSDEREVPYFHYRIT